MPSKTNIKSKNKSQKPKTKSKKKTTKAIAKREPGRPKKNSKGQVLNPKTGKYQTGRPTKINDDILQKLKSAFGYGCTDAEACAFAGISPSTLYTFQEKNPEFMEEKDGLKQMPNLKARKTVVENLEVDPELSKWWLTKRVSEEFGKAQNPDIAIQFNNVINNKKDEYGI